MAKISKGFGELLKQQRKSQGSASTKPSTIKSQTKQITPPPINYEEQEKRIGEIVGLDKDGEVKFVSEKSLSSFYEYLVQNLTLPCEVTGGKGGINIYGINYIYSLNSINYMLNKLTLSFSLVFPS